MLSAAGKVGDASRAVLNTIEEGDEAQDVLLGLAKSVANSSAALVVQAKKCAATIDDAPVREEIIASASQTALAASELVACAKVVAPTVRISFAMNFIAARTLLMCESQKSAD